MLIHKETMGVLDQYWTGRYAGAQGTLVPVMAEYTLMQGGFSPDEWWEVPRGSALGRYVRTVYPFCTPVLDAEGGLVGVRAERDARPPDALPAKRRRRRKKAGILEDMFAGL